jgi:uncharacterized membrane protein YGL010W
MSEGLRKFLKITDPITKDGARTCILLNLCAWPGLGSRLAKRNVGHLQMLLSLSGLLCVVSSLFQFMGMIWQETRYPTWHDRFVWLALGGFGAFALAWVWSFFTGLSIRDSAVTPPKHDPNMPPPL